MPVGGDTIPAGPLLSPSAADIQAMLELPDAKIHDKLKSFVTPAPSPAPEPASLKPSAVLGHTPPAAAPSGELELTFGLMDDVSAVDDDEAEEFHDATVDPVWFDSLDFADAADDTDPDEEKVSYSSDSFYDALEEVDAPVDHEAINTAIDATVKNRKFSHSSSVDSLPFSSWHTL